MRGSGILGPVIIAGGGIYLLSKMNNKQKEFLINKNKQESNVIFREQRERLQQENIPKSEKDNLIIESFPKEENLLVHKDDFAKAKRGKESQRQKDVKHGGDGEGLKGRGGKGDKHTKLRSGRESTKNRQKPGFKKYK